MNPRFIRIQDIQTRTWHHINVYHVVSVTESEVATTAPHWDPANSSSPSAMIKMVDGLLLVIIQILYLNGLLSSIKI